MLFLLSLHNFYQNNNKYYGRNWGHPPKRWSHCVQAYQTWVTHHVLIKNHLLCWPSFICLYCQSSSRFHEHLWLLHQIVALAKNWFQWIFGNLVSILDAPIIRFRILIVYAYAVQKAYPKMFWNSISNASKTHQRRGNLRMTVVLRCLIRRLHVIIVYERTSPPFNINTWPLLSLLSINLKWLRLVQFGISLIPISNLLILLNFGLHPIL